MLSCSTYTYTETYFRYERTCRAITSDVRYWSKIERTDRVRRWHPSAPKIFRCQVCVSHLTNSTSGTTSEFQSLSAPLLSCGKMVSPLPLSPALGTAQTLANQLLIRHRCVSCGSAADQLRLKSSVGIQS